MSIFNLPGMENATPKKLQELVLTRNEYVSALIDTYKMNIKNINWHLENNGRYISGEERKVCNQRITDFNNFIIELKPLL